MELVPVYFLATIVFVFGLIIGSFLDVIVSRFHTGKSINGRSRCMSCGHTLSWYELFPVLSYVFLRGRCKNCEGHIPTRLLFTELFTAFLFLFVTFHTQTLIALSFGLVLTSALIIVVLYDYNHMVIPHEFVFAVGTFALVYVATVFYATPQIQTLVPFILSAFGVSLFYSGLWLISKGKWIGLGDAKLAFVLGLFLSPEAAFSMVVFSFWIGAAVSLVLLLGQRMLVSGKRGLPFFGVPLTMKSEVPFAPFMVFSFILVFFGHVGIFSLFEHLI